jgi:hypothetical protein
MGSNSSTNQIALEPALSKEEIELFILSIISSSPGFDNLQPVPFTSISTSTASALPSVAETEAAHVPDPRKQALAKAYTIIGLMRSRGFRPITVEEYIHDFQSLNRYDHGKPIFIWRPLGLADDLQHLPSIEQDVPNLSSSVSSSSSAPSIDSIGVSTTAATVAQQHGYTTPPYSRHNPMNAPPVGEWILQFQRGRNDEGEEKMVAMPQAYPAPGSHGSEPVSVSIGWLLEDFDSEEQVAIGGSRHPHPAHDNPHHSLSLSSSSSLSSSVSASRAYRGGHQG